MKLVTFDDGRVGELRDDTVVELDVPSMREYFERAGAVRPTGDEPALEAVKLRAPRAASSALWSRNAQDCGVQPRAPGMSSQPGSGSRPGRPVRG